VLVNEGVLEVRRLGSEPDSGVRVTTTKRIKFSGLLDTPWFLEMLCYAGYLSLVEDLFCCAANKDWTAPFLARVPVDTGTRRTMGGVDPGSGAGPELGGLARHTIEQVATAAEDCIDDSAEDLKASSRKIAEGSYTADTLVQDMASMWVRMLGDGAKVAAGIGLRSARMAPRTPGPDQPGARVDTEPSTGGSGDAVAELIDDCSETAKELTRKWSHLASDVFTKLDAGTYKADSATADLAAALALAIESGARLTWEAFDALSILTGGTDHPRTLVSEEYSTGLRGAALTLTRVPRSLRGLTLPEGAVLIEPPQLGPTETKFRLRIDATGCRAGFYEGIVEASTPDGRKEDLSVHIIVA
jgi:hypothetical protein